MKTQYLCKKEVAVRFGRSTTTIERWVESGYFIKPDVGGDGSYRRWSWKLERIERWEKKNGN